MSVVNARPRIARPPTRWLNARNFSAAKFPVRELVAEKHADDGGDGKGIENPGLSGRA